LRKGGGGTGRREKWWVAGKMVKQAGQKKERAKDAPESYRPRPPAVLTGEKKRFLRGKSRTGNYQALTGGRFYKDKTLGTQ